MEASNFPGRYALRKLTAELDEALALIEGNAGAGVKQVPSRLVDERRPGKLVEECLALCAEWEGQASEPIRTVHHLACTGGTVLTKCLAAMPNTQVLSEVDPLSPIPFTNDKPVFAPADMIRQIRQATRGGSDDLIVEMFVNNLEAIHGHCLSLGQRLVLRDHAHSHFCTGPSISDRPTMRKMVLSRFNTLSIVTVRHPVDSFLSLQHNKWVHFSPESFDEYCKRYLSFLDAYAGVPVVKYEDFLEDPNGIVENMCEYLDLPFFQRFLDVFDIFQLTGDSGRQSSTVCKRSRRPIPRILRNDIAESRTYRQLIGRLGYEDVIECY